jgi:superfamily II DNA or RNA helicase
VWIFFTAGVPASTARRLGAALLREAMTARAEIDLVSYDRLFPAQDFVPNGSFGNLIALPLQGECRKQQRTVFLNPATLEPWPDQWAFLSSVARLTPEATTAVTDALRPVEVGPTVGRGFAANRTRDLPVPPVIRATLGSSVSLERIGLPPPMLALLKHTASLHNPEFYEKERLRFSTWGVPRLLRCYQEDLEHLHLPRGLLPQIERIVGDAGSRLDLVDRRANPEGVGLKFSGRLSAQQQVAMDALVAHELGVLVAPPGEGKTVIACAVVAHYQVPTLVLVDRKPLVEQWQTRLEELLGLSRKQIGQIGGGRDRRTKVVDLATIQTLVRRKNNGELFSDYGLVVVDECHHIPAKTVDICLRVASTRRWLGLTATPYRRQGLEEIIEMHCGPVRHTITVKGSVSTALLRRDLIVHETLADPKVDTNGHIQKILGALVGDDERTTEICDDVVEAVGRGRNCLVLTRRLAHVDALCRTLQTKGLQPLVLRGGMGKKARIAVTEQLAGREAPILLVATASFIGEGFDCPRLDTVFLAYPIAWKGNVVQYVGRVMRAFEGKEHVEVHQAHALQADRWIHGSRLRRTQIRPPPLTSPRRNDRADNSATNAPLPPAKPQVSTPPTGTGLEGSRSIRLSYGGEKEPYG